jgi:hypothetical protein
LGPLRALVDVLRALASPVAGRAVAEEVVLERKGGILKKTLEFEYKNLELGKLKVFAHEHKSSHLI